MKIPSLVLAGAVALTLGACALCFNSGLVDLSATYLEIPPGTNISPDGVTALQNILSQYDKRLYWVENISRKKVVDDGTQLNCVYVVKSFLDKVGQAESTGTSYYVIQVGARLYQGDCEHGRLSTRLNHSPIVPPLTPDDYRKSQELVGKVTPILQKYSQK